MNNAMNVLFGDYLEREPETETERDRNIFVEDFVSSVSNSHFNDALVRELFETACYSMQECAFEAGFKAAVELLTK